MVIHGLAGLFLVSGCGGSGSGANGSTDISEGAWEDIPLMSTTDLLVRASLDLRGIRPSEEEIVRIEEDEAAFSELVEEFLHHENFPLRVMDLFSEPFRTRFEAYPVTAADFGLEDEAEFVSAVGDEPLQILARIAAEDLPYTEIVTGNWSMANEVLGVAWPVDYPEGETGWQVVSYTDERPAAGVLATSTFYWRYPTTESNENRGRANAVSRIFLCNDYLEMPIDFSDDLDFSDDSAVSDALRTDPACMGCHSSLDPLASYFYGFWTWIDGSVMDATLYHPERELLWQNYSGLAPQYYGQPGTSLEDLGQQIAGDNRFIRCAVETVFEGLLRRDAMIEDEDHLVAHREVFLEDLTLRSLFRTLMHDSWYQAGDTDEDGAVSRKLVTVDQLSSQIEDLTGFRWTDNGFGMLQTDRDGLRTLAGGTDAQTVFRNATIPNATLLLVQERLAEAAAAHSIDTELLQSADERRLFTKIDFTETYDSDLDAVVSQIQELHLRVFGDRVSPDGQEVEANLELWGDLFELTNEPHMAWAGLLTALLRDPEILLY